MRRMRSQMRRQTFAPVIHGMRAIEIHIDLHAGPGIGPATGTGINLEKPPLDLDSVVGLHGACVFEGADPLELRPRGRGAPCRVGMRGGSGKARIVLREKVVEHVLRLRERRGMGEPEFDDEAILEGAEEALDASLIWYENVGCTLLQIGCGHSSRVMVRPSGRGASGSTQDG